jgi:heat shock protein HtpX
MAKWSTGAHVIDSPRTESEAWLIATVKKLADKAGVAVPDVAVYKGESNAFATGAFRNSALVAVSTGLLGSMSRDEVEAVPGHEMAHVANGDMVTLTLIQGVVNTFVVFLSRVVAFFVDRIMFRTERGSGPGYYITMIVCQLLLGVLASLIVAWFSRRREFRADAGSARYLGTPQPMVRALARLGGLPAGELPKSLTGFGITDKAGIAALFATHPPIEQRIRALQGQQA